MPKFLVVSARHILGRNYLGGAEVDLTDAQARPLLADGSLIDIPPVVRRMLPTRVRPSGGAWRSLSPVLLRVEPGLYDLEVRGQIVQIVVSGGENYRVATGHIADAADAAGGVAGYAGPRALSGALTDAPDAAAGSVATMGAPALNSVSAIANGFSAAWSAPSHGTPTHYDVWVSEDGAPAIVAKTVPAPATGTSVLEIAAGVAIIPGVPLAVSLSARDGTSTSPRTAPESVSATAAAGTPLAVTAPSASPGISRMYISCSAPSGGPAATDYIARWRTGAGQWVVLPDVVSPNPIQGLAHTGLTIGQSYEYRFHALNASGNGVTSAKVSTSPVSATATYYVDSVGGSDSNNGLLAGAAKSTISGVIAAMTQGDSILSVARGSTWSETYKVPRVGTQLAVHGSGAAPVFDGADAITGWALVAGETDLWERSSTRDGIAGGIDINRLWVDGVPTTAHATLAALKASGSDQNWSVSGFTATTATFYVKSASNPNSNGRLYEVSKRGHAIQAGHPQHLNNGFPVDIVGPIEIKRAYSHYNNLSLGDAATAKQLLIRDGGIHHSVVSAALMQDCIWREHGNLEGINASYEASYHVFFRSDASAMTSVAERCLGFGTAVGDRASAHFYAHGSTARPLSITYRQCASVNGQAGFLADAETVLHEGCYAQDVSANHTIGCASSTVRYCQARDVPLQTGVYAFPDLGPADNRSKTRLVEHCVITSQAALVNLINATARNGSLTVRNCLIVLEANANALAIVSAESALTVTFENNVIVRPGLPGGLKFTVDAGSGTGVTIVSNNNCWIGHRSNQATPEGIDFRLAGTSYRTLPAWRTATGNDINSVLLPAVDRAEALTYFEGDWRNGDARLKSSGVGNLVGGAPVATTCGPQYRWDWAARAVAAGAPQRWPTLPVSLADQRGYVSSPAAWQFYP